MIEKLKQQLQYGTKTIEFSIIRNRRIKTSEIIVDVDDVIVRTPFHKPVAEIYEVVRKKAKWILNKQLEYRGHNSQIIKPTYLHGSTLPYFGKNYPLKIENNQGKNGRFEFENDEFILTVLRLQRKRSGC